MFTGTHRQVGSIVASCRRGKGRMIGLWFRLLSERSCRVASRSRWVRLQHSVLWAVSGFPGRLRRDLKAFCTMLWANQNCGAINRILRLLHSNRMLGEDKCQGFQTEESFTDFAVACRHRCTATTRWVGLAQTVASESGRPELRASKVPVSLRRPGGRWSEVLYPASGLAALALKPMPNPASPP